MDGVDQVLCFPQPVPALFLCRVLPQPPGLSLVDHASRLLQHRSPPYPIAHDSRASTMHAANMIQRERSE